MGDLLGRKRVLLSGLVLFTLASLLCGLSSSQGELVAGRFVQGVAGSFTWAAGLAWLTAAAPVSRRGAMVGSALSIVTAKPQTTRGPLRAECRMTSRCVVLNLPCASATCLFAARKVASSPYDQRRTFGDRFGPVYPRPAWLKVDAHRRSCARACSVRACRAVGALENE